MIWLIKFIVSPLGRWLIGILVVVALLFGAYHKVKQVGWNERDTIAQEDDRKRRLAEDAEAHKIAAANRAREAEDAKRLTDIGNNFVGVLKDVEARRVRDVADARSRALVLRDPGAAPCPSAPGAAAAAAPGGDGPPQGGLSREASEFLLSLANEADAVVAQLTACQAVILSDRKEKR